jgi:membrane-associated protein
MLSTLSGLAGWAYLLVVLLVAGDAVFPLIPGEFAVVSGGVLAASGRLNLLALMLAAAAGAMLGDTLGYLTGRGAGRLGIGRLLRHPGSRRALVWATERLHRRAVPVLVAGRFIPGGRTVTTMVAGFLRVPPRRFALAATTGGPIWACYAAALGYLAGRATADRPWVGILAAITALTLAGLAGEGIRRLWIRRRRAQPSAAAVPAGGRSTSAPAARPGAAPSVAPASTVALDQSAPVGSPAAVGGSGRASRLRTAAPYAGSAQ